MCDVTWLRDAVGAAALLAVVMTLGDVIWAALNLPHLRLYGVAHGAIMCFVFGLVIGWRAGRLAAGAAAGPIIGVIAALVFYALAGPLRFVALLPAWMSFWIMFAFFQQWLSRADSPGITALRSIVSAVLSGLAFVAISGIWTRSSPGYHVNLGSWFVAFLPGFVTLFFRHQPRKSRN
jgi:hypothetical protein